MELKQVKSDDEVTMGQLFLFNKPEGDSSEFRNLFMFCAMGEYTYNLISVGGGGRWCENLKLDRSEIRHIRFEQLVDEKYREYFYHVPEAVAKNFEDTMKSVARCLTMGVDPRMMVSTVPRTNVKVD